MSLIPDTSADSTFFKALLSMTRPYPVPPYLRAEYLPVNLLVCVYIYIYSYHIERLAFIGPGNSATKLFRSGDRAGASAYR